MIEIVERVYDTAQKLPLGPERLAFYLGLSSVVEGMYEIEFDNPIVGGSLAVIGSVALIASFNTAAARAALDNRGNT